MKSPVAPWLSLIGMGFSLKSVLHENTVNIVRAKNKFKLKIANFGQV